MSSEKKLQRKEIYAELTGTCEIIFTQKNIFYIIRISKFLKKEIFEILWNSIPVKKISWAKMLYLKGGEVSFLVWKLSFAKRKNLDSFSFSFHTIWEGDFPATIFHLFRKKDWIFFGKEDNEGLCSKNSTAGIFRNLKGFNHLLCFL